MGAKGKLLFPESAALHYRFDLTQRKAHTHARTNNQVGTTGTELPRRACPQRAAQQRGCQPHLWRL